MQRSLKPLAVLAAGFAWACTDAPPPTAVTHAPDVAAAHPLAAVGASGPTGAIFTTMPDGGVVNANVQYQQKIEVYLDGGPGPNAPQTAAGLDDGMYVFQITDPSGKYLLSQDPAMCRVMEVANGVITRLVPATELGFASNSYKVGNTTYPCSIADNAPHPTNPGVAGASGRHDTNVDSDHGGGGAIVVQMMPFGTTPNPGGVYKAWISTLDAYKAKGGKLADVPSAVRGRDAQPCPDFCADADPGFGPPRNLQKTDNFKVKGVPPTITVDKFTDVNANGVLDGADTPLPGWKVTITETLYDNSQITNVYYTPVSAKVAQNSTVQVCEDTPTSWYLSFLYKDGVQQTATACVTVPVGTANVAFIFGNYQNATKSGVKFHDLNANAARDGGEPGLNGWTIEAWQGTTLVASTTTATLNNVVGAYSFSLKPGSYTIKENCAGQTGTWYQTVPTPDGSQTCGSGVYNVTLTSGQVEANNDFGNYQLASVSGYKINDLDGSGAQNGAESGIAGWEVHLFGTTGAGASLHRHALTDGTGKFAFTNVPPGSYTLCESGQSGWVQTYPASGVDCSTHAAGDGASSAGFGYGYSLTLQSGDAKSTGFDFLNRASQGCTPGFWQGGYGIDLWNTLNDPQWGLPRITNGSTNPFAQSTLFNDFFKSAWEVAGMTMLDIVGTGGTEVNARKAARSLIAGYLNRSAGLAYPYGLTDLVSMWNYANVTVANGTTTDTREARLLYLHTQLDAANNLHNAPLCQ